MPLSQMPSDGLSPSKKVCSAKNPGFDKNQNSPNRENNVSASDFKEF